MQIWTDDYLTWNVSDYDGLENIILPTTAVWKPDVVIING